MVAVRWLGHSTFMISGSKSVLIDPFLDGNPKAPIASADVTSCDFVVVTHSHDDHLGQAFEICARTGATLVSQYEVITRGMAAGVQNAEPMNIGGSVHNSGLSFHMVHAEHTTEWGAATGFVIDIDGKTIYHTGDTGLFGDMRLIGEFFDVDLMLCPIGDRFTMAPASAARAVQLVEPTQVIPMHYGTWPLIPGDPHEFASLVGDAAQVVIIEPGQTHQL